MIWCALAPAAPPLGPPIGTLPFTTGGQKRAVLPGNLIPDGERGGSWAHSGKTGSGNAGSLAFYWTWRTPRK